MLYLHTAPRDASPKAISGRTSYLLVRLAFHPYPHVIPSFCNRNGFEPPTAFTPPSPCTWVAHQVSCLMDATCALFRLAFAAAPAVLALACHIHKLAGSFSKRHAVRDTLARSPPTDCQHTVSGSISLPSPGFFSPFPHGTFSLSVDRSI